MAVHYYEEEDLKVEPMSAMQVVVNHAVELSKEEIEQARQEAIKNVQKEHETRMTTKKKVSKPVIDAPTLF